MKTLAQINSFKKRPGFTLIELIVVIGILAILATLVITAINPAKHIADANNAKRRSDISALLSAVLQYSLDNGNSTGLGIGQTDTDISHDGVGEVFCTILITEYLAALPVDPKVGKQSIKEDACTTQFETGYTIRVSADNRITVTAPLAERDEVIEVFN